jgi:hypothetical protein
MNTGTNRALSRGSGWALALLLLLSLALPQPGAAQPGPAACASGYALWANGQSRDETLDISGSTIAIAGKVRSNADLRISGSNNRIGGTVEYVTAFDDGGDSNSYPAPTRVAAGAPPLAYTIAAYRPGGSAAVAAQSAGRYTVISGDLDVAEPRVLEGLYYVTGDAKLSASTITGSFTIVAEGAIDVSGSSIRATPFADGLLLFANKREAGASVIKLAGSNGELRGVIYGPGGTVELSGSDNTLAGVILGDALKLNGSNLRISFAGEYCPGSPAPPPGEERPTGPPADISIGDDAVGRRVEIVNNITFVIVQITIKNTGGRASGTHLWLELDDDDDDDDDGRRRRFDLADVRFAQGSGYVRDWDGRRVWIGVGSNNVVHRNDIIIVSISFRLLDGVRGDDDDDDDGRRRGFAASGRLTFTDTSGSRAIPLPPVQVPLDATPAAPGPPPAAPSAEPARLPLERIDLRFRGEWERRGGLAIFGLPLTEARTLTDGVVVQYFERSSM